MPDHLTTHVTKSDLESQIGALGLYGAKLALFWLASEGPDSEDGQALQRALAAVDRIVVKP
jgi:hypothetical protein